MASNPENILPHRIRTAEEAREKGRAGGLRSGVKRREQASLREAARLVLSMDVVSPEASENLERLGLDADERTNAALVTARMVMEAAGGDVKAYEALSRNMGALDDAAREDAARALPDPASAFPLIDTASLVPAAWSDVWRDVMAHGHDEYIGESGRGSLKSTVLGGLAPIMLMLADPHLCGVAFRQVANTLRDSAFATLASAIRRLGVEDQFELTVSPMRITRVATGQVILFRGLDDPEKAKSLQLDDPGMYVGFAVWEEFDQFRGMAQVRKVQQTVRRGGAPRFWTFRMFNTPRNDAHWAHAYARDAEESGRALVCRATYLDVPREFLGEAFHADAEALREIDPDAYANEYLGKAVGRKGRVFLNLERRDVTDEERDGLKWMRCGVDWGYAVAPWVLVQVGYDSRTKTVYVLRESYGLRLSNESSAGRTREVLADSDGGFLPHAPRNRIYADSAEPKSIASWRELGLDCVPARKWPGSVEAGIRWMQERARIVVDRSCALAWQELSAYDYEADADGEPIEDAYPDRDNHAIDAVRYALSELVAKKKEV
ncbi:phage terminase large subunit [Slackia exigua]|uniref:PBSX family phage terminase large subunit n=1 Tax=Slackia exigua TaxID=84109 RepID=UPI0028D250E4|nr:phage terminase large subunit [Slackia exigua]